MVKIYTSKSRKENFLKIDNFMKNELQFFNTLSIKLFKCIKLLENYVNLKGYCSFITNILKLTHTIIGVIIYCSPLSLP